MAALRTLLRYLTFPLFLLGANAWLILLVESGAPLWQPLLVLCGAILLMLAIERIIPWQPAWNRAHQDGLRDLLHGAVNTGSYHLGILLLPLFAQLTLTPEAWPAHWPFWLQVVFSLLVLDIGVSAAHHASHKWNWLGVSMPCITAFAGSTDSTAS